MTNHIVHRCSNCLVLCTTVLEIVQCLTPTVSDIDNICWQCQSLRVSTVCIRAVRYRQYQHSSSSTFVVVHDAVVTGDTSRGTWRWCQNACIMAIALAPFKEAKRMADLHEVARGDCLANIAVVVFGPEVCALHLNPHARAYTHLHRHE